MTTTSTTMIEKHQALKKGPIAIRPYFDPTVSNMGLEKYNLSLYDGVFHEENLACVESNGVIRYITGLNEFSPDIKLMEDKDLKEAKIKQIRKTVAQLERELASNVIDPEDPDFWNKVKILRPDNHEFWGKITLRVGNEFRVLDVEKDPHDLIKLNAIEAGGFPLIAKSYEIARAMPQPPKFYLDKYEDTIATKSEPRKLKNRALAELTKLYDKNTNKLFYIAKVVDVNSVQYKKNTPNDLIYDNLDKYINGEGLEKNAKRAAEEFLAASELDMATLKIRALIKDASYYKYIQLKPDGFFYHTETNSLLGRNISDMIEFLKNAINEDILNKLMLKVEKDWIRG